MVRKAVNPEVDWRKKVKGGRWIWDRPAKPQVLRGASDAAWDWLWPLTRGSLFPSAISGHGDSLKGLRS